MGVQHEKKLPYPKSVFFIVSNEFCERFSFYGMRTILVLYLTRQLLYSENDAKVIFHLFTMFVYFFPIFGAILADSFLGKFRTIFYVSIVYSIGNIVLAIAGITPLKLPQTEISLLGLMLIAIGTGGIKPCVAAFGGDQFTLPQQEKQLARFFSIFYFSINAGSLCSTILTPILREKVHCFGQESCFPLAFGVPGILMITAVVIFLAGKPLYKISQPTGNVMVEVIKCISRAVKNKIKLRRTVTKDHWLEFADDKYDKQLIQDIKATLRVLLMFIPIPVFWALFDQQGTGWTFTATRLNGDVGLFTILPDQFQVLNPLLILIFIPLFESCVYPFFGKFGMLTRPLQRITVGGLLAAAAFVLSGFLEMEVEKTYPVVPTNGQAQLRIYNAMNCSIKISGFEESINLDQLSQYENKLVAVDGKKTYNMTFDMKNCGQNVTSLEFDLTEKTMQALVIAGGKVESVADDIQKSNDGNPRVRIVVQSDSEKTIELKDSKGETKLSTKTNDYKLHDLHPDIYKVYVDEEEVGRITLKLGGVYSIVISGKDIREYIVTEPNSINMLWLIPQYVFITMGEIMFSVTGLEFAYSQAPISMKSVLQAAWLLTTAIGNLLVVVVEKARVFNSQASQYFLYAALMVLDMVIFALMAMKYKYVQRESDEGEGEGEGDVVEQPTTSGKARKAIGIENAAYKPDEIH